MTPCCLWLSTVGLNRPTRLMDPTIGSAVGPPPPATGAQPWAQEGLGRLAAAAPELAARSTGATWAAAPSVPDLQEVDVSCAPAAVPQAELDRDPPTGSLPHYGPQQVVRPQSGVDLDRQRAAGVQLRARLHTHQVAAGKGPPMTRAHRSRPGRVRPVCCSHLEQYEGQAIQRSPHTLQLPNWTTQPDRLSSDRA